MNIDDFKVRLLSMLRDGMTVSKVMECVDLALGTEPKEQDVLQMYLDAKAVEEKSPETIKLYRCILTQFLSTVTCSVASITTSDVRHFLSVCKDSGQKASTISNTRRILSSFFEWCVLERLVTLNPVKRISAIKVEKSPRKAMKRIELEYIRSACADLRERALVDFLYSTGARVSEVCHAEITDIDWDRHSVIIRQGKGNVTRETFLNPAAEVSLRSYLASRSDTSPFIFTRSRGSSNEPLNPKTIQETIDKITARSGWRFSIRITPHVFRHTIATVLLQNGMPVEQVQRFLGHSKMDTTLIYAEVSNDDVRRSHSLYAA